MSNNNVFKQASAVIVVTLLCFFVVPALSINLDTNIALSIGVLVGGSLAIFLSGNTSSAKIEGDDKPLETKTIYVGNLPYRANEAAVKDLFAKYGVVSSVRLMRDRNTGKRKGFGFVEMDEQGADKAISALNEQEFQQRTLKVREAKDKSSDD
ncbi:RNA-binding protein [Catenovulum sp. 2E275]|uniref:RNA recognition motif domain-containing protein n=1 Tax=Catenovulum sp. 2E275 TaxID=2980497 RepID=UPI0021D2831A|nr:RNA-binding protein [Catenovulum sp. 2E275]MCU4675509.1 RNA-binding protein [Catenovulum sp. 2E275]